MADKTLESDLSLDITAALKAVDRLDEAITRATTGVQITADARAVTAAIDAAVLNASTDVVVEGDARQLTSSIDSAVDASDTAIEVTAEAGRVTASIDSAVDSADTSVEVTGTATQVTSAIEGAVGVADTSVEVTGGVDPATNTDVLNLVANIADAKDEAGGLAGVLAGLSVGAAAAGLYTLAEAASELEQSVGGTGAVFGEASGIIDAFATTAAGAAGLTETAARTLTSQIGGLLKGFGFTRREAALLSVQLAQLGADLAATFGGSPQEAVEALGAALRGEFNPLERFGIALNVAQINAHAVATGLAASTEEVGIAERAQSALSIILERSADAQGQFNRELDTAGGALSVARAEAGNLAAEAGEHLTPALIALVDVITREVAPDLAQMGEQLLPAISDAIINLAPLLGVTTDILLALSPVLEVVASVLAAIPDEAVAVATAMVILNVAIGTTVGLFGGLIGAFAAAPAIIAGTAVATRTAAAGVGLFARGITGLATGLAALNPLTVAAAVFGGSLFYAWQQGKREAAAFEREVNELGQGLETLDGIQQLTTAGVSKYVNEYSKLKAKDQLADLQELGIGFEQVARLAQQGEQGLATFTRTLEAGGDLTRVYRDNLGNVVDGNGEIIDSNSELGRSMEEINGQLYVGNTEVVRSFEEVQAVTEEAAKRQLDLLQTQGLLTQEQLTSALAFTATGESVGSYADALNRVEPIVVATAKAQAAALAAGDQLAASYLGVGNALAALETKAPTVVGAINEVRDGVGTVDMRFLFLAQSIDAAALSEEDMALAATALGTDVESLSGFVETATTALQDFADTAVGALPAIGDAFDTIGDDETLGVNDFIANLDRLTNELVTWHANLNSLTDAGYADLAGTIAQQGPEIAGALAQEMVDALDSGNLEILDSVRQSVDDFNNTWTDTTAYLRDTLGPEFILTTGLIGSAATASFGENLDFGERIKLANAAAALDMDESGKAIAVVAAVEGEEAAREYGAALDLPQQTVDAAVAAGLTLTRDDAGLLGIASSYGESTGDNIGRGIGDGIENATDFVRAAARAAVAAAKKAADEKADANSPSRLFAEVGRDLGEGMALGLQRETTRVSDEAAALVAAAAEAAGSLTVPMYVELSSLDGAASIAELQARIAAEENTTAQDIALGGGGEATMLSLELRKLMETMQYGANAPAIVSLNAELERLARQSISVAGTTDGVQVTVQMPVTFSELPRSTADAEALGRALGAGAGDEAGRRLLRMLTRAAT